MRLAWGLIVTVLSAVAWGGQAVSWLARPTAERLGLTERRREVEPLYWLDIRGEAAWDTFTLWPMVVAGVLLAADEPTWAYYGLAGGAAYLYFSGRGIVTRMLMTRQGMRVGSPSGVRTALAVLALWGAMSVITIALAVADLDTP